MKILCWVGWHKWIELAVFSVGSRGAGDLKTTEHARCARCGKERFRPVDMRAPHRNPYKFR